MKEQIIYYVYMVYTIGKPQMEKYEPFGDNYVNPVIVRTKPFLLFNDPCYRWRYKRWLYFININVPKTFLLIMYVRLVTGKCRQIVCRRQNYV